MVAHVILLTMPCKSTEQIVMHMKFDPNATYFFRIIYMYIYIYIYISWNSKIRNTHANQTLIEYLKIVISIVIQLSNYIRNFTRCHDTYDKTCNFCWINETNKDKEGYTQIVEWNKFWKKYDIMGNRSWRFLGVEQRFVDQDPPW